MSAPLPGLPLPQNLSASVTRILHLSGFPPELKTRDIHSAFQAWENDKGGFKIKWIDDTSALVVFQDAIVAKRAYLQTLLTPPAVLVSPTSTLPLQIRPYDGPDAQAIISNVNSRSTGPPSRQNSQNAHQSRASFSIPAGGSGSGHIRAASMAAAIPSVGGHSMSSSMSLGQLAGSAASRWAPKGDGSTPPALPELPYQAPLGAMINGSALATSPPIEEAPAVQGGARIGDAGRRMVAGALGVRHPSLRRNSPPSASASGSEITA